MSLIFQWYNYLVNFNAINQSKKLPATHYIIYTLMGKTYSLVLSLIISLMLNFLSHLLFNYFPSSRERNKQKHPSMKLSPTNIFYDVMSLTLFFYLTILHT